MYLQGDDLSFRTFGSLVPCHCTVASVAADLKDCQHDQGKGLSGANKRLGTSLRLLLLSEKFHCSPLEGRRHLVCVEKITACPIPELFHILGHVV